jgi:hypothetical protein
LKPRSPQRIGPPIAHYLYLTEAGFIAGRVDRYKFETTKGPGKSFPTAHLPEPVNPETIPALQKWLLACNLDTAAAFSELRPDSTNLMVKAAVAAIKWLPWEWKHPPLEQALLYRLPALIKAPTNSTVYLCEGEKDTLTVVKLGGQAVTVMGGARRWSILHNQWFAGKRVVVLAHNEDAGRNWAEVVRAELRRLARSVGVAVMPEGFNDVTEWVEAQNNATLTDLEAVVKTGTVQAPDPKSDLAKSARISRIVMRKAEEWVDRNGFELYSSTLNLKNAFRLMRVKVRYNELSNKIELSGTGHKVYEGSAKDQVANWFKYRIALMFGFEASIRSIWGTIEDQAQLNAYHPVRDYLNGTSWDNQPRGHSWLPTYLGTQIPNSIGLLVGQHCCRW